MCKKINENYFIIDILRVVFAICVFVLHTQILQILLSEKVYWWIEHLLIRLAVPFFFVVSGYFVGEKLHIEPEKTFFIYKKYCIKILLPLIVWGTLNMPFEIARWCQGYSTKETILYCIKTVLCYPPGAMWFLWSCIVTLTFIYMIWKCKFRYWIIIIVAIITTITIALCDSYYFIATMNSYLAKYVRYFYRYFVSPRILYGVLFISIGIVLSKISIRNDKKILHGSNKLIIVFLILAILETKYLYGKELFYHSEILLSYIGLVPCIVLMSLKYTSNNVIQSNKMRKISTGIYYTHSFVLEIAGLFIENIVLKFFVVLVGMLMLIGLLQKGKWTNKLV